MHNTTRERQNNPIVRQLEIVKHEISRAYETMKTSVLALIDEYRAYTPSPEHVTTVTREIKATRIPHEEYIRMLSEKYVRSTGERRQWWLELLNNALRRSQAIIESQDGGASFAV